MASQPTAAHSVFVLALILSLVTSRALAVKAGGGGGGGGGRTTTGGSSTTGTGSRSYPSVYGRSYGAQTQIRIVTAVVITAVIFHGYSYPTMRFYYDGYYDDCALRNVTAVQAGGLDSQIDPLTVQNTLPTLSTNYAADDLAVFNQTLYNQTNGLIVDPAYCNYTQSNPPSGSGTIHRPAVIAVVLPLLAGAAVAALAG